MTKRKKLEGMKFADLTVFEYLGQKSRNPGSSKKSMYNCLCVCGKMVEVEAQNLQSGNSKSCGCKAYESRSGENSNLWKGVGKWRAEYNRQVRSAQNRELPFQLTFEETQTIMSSNCFYCDNQPKDDNRGLVRNGIDRLDSSKGYLISNTVPCCSTCNAMKMGIPYGEFIDKISKIYNNLIKG